MTLNNTIADDRLAGASELARRAVTLLAGRVAELGSLDAVRSEKEAIGALRPSMVAIDGALGIFVGELEKALEAGMPLIRAAATALADSMLTLDGIREKVVTGTIEAMARRPHGRVVTVSCSSTVMAVLDRRPPPALLVGEGRPGLEGRNLARRYAVRGVPVELCVDAALPGLLRETDLVLVGADGVQADGWLVNKTGTRAVALAAGRLGAPVLVCCESFKISGSARIPLEVMDPAEVWGDGPAPVKVTNVYFERIPPGLVTGFVTDLGFIHPVDGPWPTSGKGA